MTSDHQTADGYVKISKVEDLEKQLQEFPQIDTIRIEHDAPLVYVALWCEEEKRGYGGCFISRSSFEQFKEAHSHLKFVGRVVVKDKWEQQDSNP